MRYGIVDLADRINWAWLNEQLVDCFPSSTGRRRRFGDTALAASTSEVTTLLGEARELKQVVAEWILELRHLKQSMITYKDTGRISAPRPF